MAQPGSSTATGVERRPGGSIPRCASGSSSCAGRAATFRDQEAAAGYLEILTTTVRTHGLPGAVYHDRHSSFAPTHPAPGEPGAPAELSQVGRALVELDIGSIVARSPQAKGRI